MNGPREAACLLCKALQPGLSPANDIEYRELLAQYRSDADFARMVNEVTLGLELIVLDVSERGLIVAPASRESRFSLRLTDLRQNLNNEQKVAFLMAHLAICVVFFPTTDCLEDDALTPLPASVARFRDTLLSLAKRLAERISPDMSGAELQPGWELLKRLPSALPKAERASLSSVEGFIRLALSHLVEHRLLRPAREHEDANQTLYTATHRLRVHLRELTWGKLFDVAREILADNPPIKRD